MDDDTNVEMTVSEEIDEEEPTGVNDNVEDDEMEPTSSYANEDLQVSTEGKENSAKEPHEKLVQLPISRIKHIMKMDPTVTLASQEAVFLITRCTELFIESLARESFKHTSASKRKTVQRKDMDMAITSCESLEFLEGSLPQD